MIQLHRLEGFYRVAVARNYTHAAREFPYPISQPGVYQQVRKLEQDLGSTLFERVGRDRVELTAQGRALFAFCAPFFEQLPLIERAISGRQIGGLLRIDAAPLEIRHILPPWIKRLRRSRPDIDLELVEMQVPDLARLRRGETDLVVDYVPDPPRGVSVRRIASHYAFLITPSDYPQHEKRSRWIAALRERPFISYHPNQFHHAMQMHGLSRLGIEAREQLSASSTEAILGLVLAGLGYSLVPWPSASGPRVAGVRALRLRGAGTEFPVVAAWKSRAVADPLIEAALGAL